MLLGASISFSAIVASGAGLMAGTVAPIALVLAVSYGLGRLLGVPQQIALPE